MLTSSLFTIIFLATLVYYTNHFRQKLRYQFQIHKNCLLTQYPIVFLNGHSSPFYFGRYWNYIPDWLEAHGYDILDFNFSSNEITQRKNELKAFLEIANEQKFHFIGDSSTIEELEWLSSLNNPSVKSLSVVNTQSLPLHNKNIKELLIFSPKRERTPRLYWKTMAKLHSLTSSPLKTEVVGLSDTEDLSPIARQYLNWAISLAESDMSC